MTINKGFKGTGLLSNPLTTSANSPNLNLQGKFTKNEAFYLAQSGDWYNPSNSFTISMLAVGAGGGMGGEDVDVPMAGGSGAAVSADYVYTPGEVLYIEVGGGGGSGSQDANFTPGYNNGGRGGDAGGESGSGGGGGGWSGIYKDPSPLGVTHPATTFLIVAGGGAGGGGSWEGPANDVIAHGGGQQNNYTPTAANLTAGGSFQGNSGFPYGAIGDGGGFGAAGGGRWGGETWPAPATGPASCWGGGNYLGPNVINTGVVNGNPALKGTGGQVANINWWGYSWRNDLTGANVVIGEGFGRGATTNRDPYVGQYRIRSISNGAPGGVIIRYRGLPKLRGGNVVTKGGFTFHTYTAPGTFGGLKPNPLPLPGTAGTNQIQYMVVGGGAGGSGSGGGTPPVRGGGGAGGYFFGNLTPSLDTDYYFIVAAGGAAAPTALPIRQGQPGSPTDFWGGVLGSISVGGGEAGWYDQGGASQNFPGVGVPGTGTGGGGGGMGATAFTPVTANHTNGGNGILVSWLVDITANIGGGIGAFGGGGGGTAMPAPGPVVGVGPGVGGYGGGGSGAAGYLNTTGRTEALAFTGSGGGASQDGTSTRGGSGTIILRQPSTSRPPQIFFANTYEQFYKGTFLYTLLRGSGTFSWPSEGNFRPLRGNIGNPGPAPL